LIWSTKRRIFGGFFAI